MKIHYVMFEKRNPRPYDIDVIKSKETKMAGDEDGNRTQSEIVTFLDFCIGLAISERPLQN